MTEEIETPVPAPSLSREQWDVKYSLAYKVLRNDPRTRDHAEQLARDYVTQELGPRPDSPSDPTKPSRWRAVKLGFGILASLLRFKNMKFKLSVGTVVPAVIAGVVAIGPVWAVVFADKAISLGEVGSLVWAFGVAVLAYLKQHPEQ